MKSLYENQEIWLTTKHKKHLAIGPVFEELLGARVRVIELDTDTLGTFTGEVPRVDSAGAVAKKKCSWGIEAVSGFVGLASEGSFGPHPHMPFCASNHEILYFIDKKLNFELQVSKITEQTNYNQRQVEDLEALSEFAKDVDFPSHGLILRQADGRCLKDISDWATLEIEYHKATALQPGQSILAQTDMRAHMNPTRMNVIKQCAEMLAERLLKSCPVCQCPGWGVVEYHSGLPCRLCHNPTQIKKADVYACARCGHKEFVPFQDEYADSWYCNICNP